MFRRVVYAEEDIEGIYMFQRVSYTEVDNCNLSERSWYRKIQLFVRMNA